jgi:hypothetical protein
MCATASDIKNQQEETAQQQTAETGLFFCFWVFSLLCPLQANPKTQNQKKKTQNTRDN